MYPLSTYTAFFPHPAPLSTTTAAIKEWLVEERDWAVWMIMGLGRLVGVVVALSLAVGMGIMSDVAVVDIWWKVVRGVRTWRGWFVGYGRVGERLPRGFVEGVREVPQEGLVGEEARNWRRFD